nr:DUF2945 domain-containing protein [Pseudooceanicola onchidii]
MQMIREGTQVKWSWGNGSASGKVEERFTREVTRTLKGEEVTRKGSDDNPALLIVQEDGDKVLKLHSEVERA